MMFLFVAEGEHSEEASQPRLQAPPERVRGSHWNGHQHPDCSPQRHHRLHNCVQGALACVLRVWGLKDAIGILACLRFPMT